jgi:hypothetical protein
VPLWLGAAVALAFLLGLTLALAAGGPPDGPAPARSGESDGRAAFRLSLAADGRSVTLSGLFDFGLTRALEALLAEAPEVDLLRLNSGGGRVAEARGVALLVHRHGLAASAVSECSSACTLVLLSAAERYLEPGARLGFHRYGLHSPMVALFLDPEAEQARDLALLRGRTVAEAFLARVAATPHETMWFPTTAELIDAGVVDAVRPPP